MQTVEVQPAGIQCPDVTSHIRAAVTGAAGTLTSFLSTAAIPTFGGRRPDVVYVGQEQASTGTVYVVWDGKSTPSATLGFVVPVLPNFLLIPKKGGVGLQDADISVYASTGTQYLQCKFEWSQS
jgi:hypothetical protein